MSKRVNLLGSTINFTTHRVDAVINFSADYHQLITGDGSETHLKKCLLSALLKEAKEEGGALIEALKDSEWNFVVEPGMDLSHKFKQHGYESLPIMKVQRVPSLEEFCKGRGIEIKEVPSNEE